VHNQVIAIDQRLRPPELHADRRAIGHIEAR
jgi:hypothetical protein